MGEYNCEEYKEKKPVEKKDCCCNVHITVYCGQDKKKDDKCEKYDPCKPFPYPDKKECEGCNVFITVFCDGCDKKKD